MPADHPADPRPRAVVAAVTSRRAVLIAWGAALFAAPALAGCGIDPSAIRLDDMPTPTPPVLGPDDLARFAAVERVQGLHQLAGAVVAGSRRTVALAAGAVDDHAAHLAQLGPLPGPVPSPSATPQGWPTGMAPATAPVPAPTPEELAEAEHACAVDLLGRVSEVDGPLARLLTSVASSCGVLASALASAAGASAPAPLVPAALPARLPPEADTDDLKALHGLLTAHDAAAYGLGVLAVRLAESGRERATTAMARHRGEAARMAASVAVAGLTLEPRPPAFALAVPADPAAAVALAGRLELDVADAAGALVASADGDLRALGVRSLVDAAAAASRWVLLPPFPGMPELA